MSKELRKSLALEWALDLLDLYDKMLVSLGEPEEKVYSEIHVRGKKEARDLLAKQEAAPPRLSEEQLRGMIEAVAREAVELAIVRSELHWDESSEQTEAEIAQDAADALFGDGTCAGEPTHSAKQLIAHMNAALASVPQPPPAPDASGEQPICGTIIGRFAGKTILCNLPKGHEKHNIIFI